MKKIKIVFLVLFVISLLTQTTVFCACDKVKKACSISDLNKTSQVEKIQKTVIKEQFPEKQGIKDSIKAWLKSLK